MNDPDYALQVPPLIGRSRDIDAVFRQTSRLEAILQRCMEVLLGLSNIADWLEPSREALKELVALQRSAVPALEEACNATVATLGAERLSAAWVAMSIYLTSVVIGVLLYFTVLAPISGQLEQEENVSMSMLFMVPRHLRDGIDAIREFQRTRLSGAAREYTRGPT